MITAILIGIAFGWSLEQAGLGDAQKLAGQFYLRDFTVIKVMLSAIVTAMLGLFWLGRLGLIDLAAIYGPETWLIPQIVGGLVFGTGFVISGLCPGTACVAMAGGRGDGVATVLGLFVGILATGLAWSWIEGFADRTAYGAFTLPQLTDLPYGVVVAGLTVAGVAGLFTLELVERRRV